MSLSSGAALPMRSCAHGVGRTLRGVGCTVGLVLPLSYPSSSLPPSPSLLRYPRGYVEPIIRSVFDIARGDIGVPSDVGVGGVGNNRAGRRRRIHAAVWSIRVWRVLAWLWDLIWRMCGVAARVFGGGGHAFGCHYCHRCCCVATAGMGVMMTLSSSPSTARAVFLCAHVVSGRRWQWVPTWLLLGCCLYLLFSSSLLLLSSFFPTPHSFLTISLLHTQTERVVDPAFGFVRGGWLWWVGYAN